VGIQAKKNLYPNSPIVMTHGLQRVDKTSHATVPLNTP